jgi:hypothetical protein
MKKIELNGEKNGIPFEWIIRTDDMGNIIDSMDKPKIISPEIHFSGAHIFQSHSENNHYDHYANGSEWKDYSKENKYPLKIQDNKIVFLE